VSSTRLCRASSCSAVGVGGTVVEEVGEEPGEELGEGEGCVVFCPW